MKTNLELVISLDFIVVLLKMWNIIKKIKISNFKTFYKFIIVNFRIS